MPSLRILAWAGLIAVGLGSPLPAQDARPPEGGKKPMATVASLIVGHTTSDSVALAVELNRPSWTWLTVASTDGDSRQWKRVWAKGKERRLRVEFRGLDPRTEYRILGGGTRKPGGELVGTFRTLPRPNEDVAFKIGFGSCMNARQPRTWEHPGGKRREVENHIIWPRLGKEPMDLFLWIGDRFYLPNTYEDYKGKSSAEVLGLLEDMHQGFLSVPGVRAFVSSRPQYVIWDDHDYGPNDSAGDFKFKKEALAAMRSAFANPPMGEGGKGCYFKLSLGRVDLFLLDDRWFRSCANVKRQWRGRAFHSCTPNVLRQADGTFVAQPPLDAIFGAQQLAWLRKGLQESRATFKLVVSGNQILSNIHKWEAWYHSKERKEFLDWMRKTRVPGVVFVSGDRHHGEIGRLRGGPYPLYEVTSSGIGVNVYPGDQDTPESPYDVVAGPIEVHNFGVIEYDPAEGGTLKLRVVGRDGKEASRTIRAAELRSK